MIIERKPKSAIVEEVLNFKKEDKETVVEEVKSVEEEQKVVEGVVSLSESQEIIGEKVADLTGATKVKPAESVLDVKVEEKKCENCIECEDRKAVAEQVTKLKEEHIKHKVTKKDDKFIIECFGKVVKEDIDDEETDDMISDLRKHVEEFLIKWIAKGLSRSEFLSAFESIYENIVEHSDLKEEVQLKESLQDDKPTVDDIVKFLRKTADSFESNYDLESPVKKVSNTYFLGQPRYFLGIAGTDGGYINLDSPIDDEYDESLKSKSVKESWEGEDIIDDLVDRAKSLIEEGQDASDAVSEAIDAGLIYTDDIFALAQHYGSIDDSALIESYYDDLYNDIYSNLDLDESLKEDVDSLSTADIKKKIENIKKGIADDEERISKMKAEKEETNDENRKRTLDNKIESAEKEVEKKQKTLSDNEEKLAKSKADDDKKIRDDFTNRVSKAYFPGKGHKISDKDIEPTEEEIRAYDDIANFLKDNVTIYIETSAEKEALLRRMLPDLEEGQYRVVKGETSGGYPMKFGISMTLHANNLEGCPEEFRDMFKDGDLTTIEEVYGILRTHFEDFKDSIGPKKKEIEVKDETVEVKEEVVTEAKSSKVEQIKSKVLKFLDRIGYNEKDFEEYFVIEEKEFVNDEGDKATHIQIRNDLVDYYEAEADGLIAELDKIVEPGYFEPYDAYVWDAYIWENEVKENLHEDLEDISIDDIEDVEVKAEEPKVDEVDDEVVYFSTDEVKDVVEDVVDEIGDEMEDKEPEEVDVEEIIDEKIADAVEEKKEEESEDVEDDVSGLEDEEVVDVDYSDDDISEEDAQFLENLNISNNYKNEPKSEEQQKLDEELGPVVIKDDLGVEEDISEEDMEALSQLGE